MADDEAMADRAFQDRMVRRIRVLLAWRDWSEVQLATKIDKDQAYLSRRMTGTTLFNVRDLRKIAEALEVDPAELFPSETPPPIPAVATESRVVTRGGSRSRRLTGSYPAHGAGTSPVRAPVPAASSTRRPRHSPDRPPTRTDRQHVDRPVRLDRPDTRKRPEHPYGDDVL